MSANACLAHHDAGGQDWLSNLVGASGLVSDNPYGTATFVGNRPMCAAASLAGDKLLDWNQWLRVRSIGSCCWLPWRQVWLDAGGIPRRQPDGWEIIL